MKKRFFKTISVMLMVVFAIGLLSACGTSSSSSSDDDTTSSNTFEDTTVDEQVILDQDDITVTVTDCEYDSTYGLTFNLLIENNSDQDIDLDATDIIVNGYSFDSNYFISSVVAGTKSNEEMYIDTDVLEALGITNVGEIEVYFECIDDDTYDDIFTTDAISIQTSEYDDMDTTMDFDGEEIYSQDGITITAEYLESSDYWGQSVVLCIDNESDNDILVDSDSFVINGYMIDDYVYSTVLSGTKAISAFYIYDEDLSDNDIDTIETIGASFEIDDYNSWDTIDETDVLDISVD